MAWCTRAVASADRGLARGALLRQGAGQHGGHDGVDRGARLAVEHEAVGAGAGCVKR